LRDYCETHKLDGSPPKVSIGRPSRDSLGSEASSSRSEMSHVDQRDCAGSHSRMSDEDAEQATSSSTQATSSAVKSQPFGRPGMIKRGGFGSPSATPQTSQPAHPLPKTGHQKED
jgi:hypothetical protein